MNTDNKKTIRKRFESNSFSDLCNLCLSVANEVIDRRGTK